MYYLVEEDIEERRIDFLNIIQLKELVKDIVVLDSQIIVQLEYFALIFNQKDMMLGQIIQLPNDPKREMRKFNTQILNPFGYRGKQYIDHDGLLYCYTIKGEARLVRSTKIATNSILLKQKIKEKAPNIALVGITPSRYVSPSGTCTWLFNVTSFDSTAAIKDPEETSLNAKLQDDLVGGETKKTKLMIATMAKLEVYLDKFGKEVKPDKICELYPDEQRHCGYLIMTEEFPQKIGDFQILQTRHYLVINTLTEILYIRKDAISPLEKGAT